MTNESTGENTPLRAWWRNEMKERQGLWVTFGLVTFILAAWAFNHATSDHSPGSASTANSGNLNSSSSCADWNDATLNDQSHYVIDQIRAGVPGLNRWTGYASGEISRYCGYDPTANLGAITTKVSRG